MTRLGDTRVMTIETVFLAMLVVMFAASLGALERRVHGTRTETDAEITAVRHEYEIRLCRMRERDTLTVRIRALAMRSHNARR